MCFQPVSTPRGATRCNVTETRFLKEHFDITHNLHSCYLESWQEQQLSSSVFPFMVQVTRYSEGRGNLRKREAGEGRNDKEREESWQEKGKERVEQTGRCPVRFSAGTQIVLTASLQANAEINIFFKLPWGGVKLSPLATSDSNWSIVATPDDRWV